MAATGSAWAKPGAWALDSEELEAELLQQQKEETINGNLQFDGHDASKAVGLSDFPSLSAAAATKTKKKKAQTLSLRQFTNHGSSKPAQPKGLTAEDLMMLPTGPRQRTAEELDRSRLGCDFRSYGSNDRNNRYSNGDESSNSRWGSSKTSDEPRRQGWFGTDLNREFASSRADEIDDWGAAKKSTVDNGFERRERGVFFDSQSRADESESWVSNKSFVPSERRSFRSSGAFDSLREKRWGFESTNGCVDSDGWGKKREEGSGGGRPRLTLQPRTLPVGEGQQNGVANVKPKASSPFGDARPREEVLKEKGQDWKEIDERLESVKIKDKDVGSTDEPSFGNRSFGSGNGRAISPEDRTDKSWRKMDSVDVSPPSADKIENGLAEEEEAEDRGP